MAKNLVIVESPAKAKTIAGYLGSDFRVESSFGHIRDLPKKDLSVDIKAGFEPTYVVSEGKEKVVRNLKSASKGATIWLASDGDREGEAIAWHVCIALGIKPEAAKRIVFHEITKPAITAAIEAPRTIDMKLVEAQQARRILDRLVGYELSPVLWKKVRAGLSAGRVQSVAVRLIVEREREIRDFKPVAFYKVSAIFNGGSEFPAELTENLKDSADTEKFLKSVASSKFSVGTITQKPGTRSPGAPFTTSTLQQEAGRKLGYSVRQTMTLAQRLYEQGHITYMRTDSTNLSPLAIDAAKAYIVKNFGGSYSDSKHYKTKTKSAQEAHEAIRPTNLNKLSAGADAQQSKLYSLIWKRMLASQMAVAKVQKTEVTIDIAGSSKKFLAVGEILSFDGFLKVYGGGKDDKILPDLTQGQALKLVSMSGLESFHRSPARYSEPALVKKLEELGIGRPSTYAPTIGTIQDRGYVEKKDIEGEAYGLTELYLKDGKLGRQTVQTTLRSDRNKLVPTTLAEIVTDFLIKYFAGIVDYGFTASTEEDLDNIADGKLTWKTMLEDFYKNFHPLITKSNQASRAEATGARKLGKDPKTSLPVIVRFGRYGPVLQLGEASTDKDAKDIAEPRFAPLPEGSTLEDVTLDQALPMFKLPREVGSTAAGEIITADIGRYGPYVKADKLFVSIKGQDPLKISEEQARKLIVDKQKAIKEKVIADFGKLKILNGPYGPYVTDGKKNTRIPKGDKPQKITEARAKVILSEAPASKSRRYTKKK